MRCLGCFSTHVCSTILLLSVGCGETTAPVRDPSSPPPPRIDIKTSAGAVWAVGGGGLIHYDADRGWSTTEWSSDMGTGYTYGPNFSDVWAASATAAWVIGNSSWKVHNAFVWRYNGTDWVGAGDIFGAGPQLTAVSGTSANNVFVVGGVPARWRNFYWNGDWAVGAHFDGAAWEPFSFWTYDALFDVSGRSLSDYYVIAERAILHYDGASWSSVGLGTGTRLTGIWTAAGADAFAVGNAGVILRNRGAGWEPMSSGTDRSLRAVWGTSSTDVYAVGDSGTILHYDGSGWSGVASPTDAWLDAIWGSSSTDVFAVGAAGTILHYDGRAWTAMSSGSINNLRSISGSSPDDVFAVGHDGTVLHYDGVSWSPVPSGTSEWLIEVWATSANDVTAIGGGRILHYDGTAWTITRESDAELNRPYALWGIAGELRAAGWPGLILANDGSGWRTLERAPSAFFREVWAHGNQAFALADAIWHYNGESCRRLDGPEPEQVQRLTALWGASPTDLFAIGADGLILHYDGAQWTEMASGTTARLTGIWGAGSADVFVVGTGGTILHYDGSAWTAMASGTTESLVDVAGVAGNDVFAVSQKTILHYDGTAWKSLPAFTDQPLITAVWAVR